MKHRFHIPDMSCGHCKKTIEDALRGIGVDQVNLDLDDKTVTVVSELDVEALEATIRDAGYTPSIE